MKTVVIKEDTLKKAIENLTDRNALFIDIQQASSNPEKHYLKLILAFWLGDTIALSHLKQTYPDKFEKHYITIYSIYYCLLDIERNIFYYEKNSAPYEILDKWRKYILFSFNAYPITCLDPTEIFLDKCLNLIKSNDLQSIHEIKENCLTALIRHPKYHKDSVRKPTLRELLSSFLTAISGIEKQDFKNKMQSVIALSHNRQQFFGAQNFDSPLRFHKILLPSYDKTIIEGLRVGKSYAPAKTCVLALVGHFSFEDNYIGSDIHNFHDFFDTDIIFINHRNYAQRAGKSAQNIHELASDIVCFAKYLARSNINIVLYGMCGGAAQMITAATALHQEDIKFKLIVDRFPRKYADFFSLNTLRKGLQYHNFNMHWLLFFLILNALTLAFIPIVFLKILILLVSENHIDFAKQIMQLPEEDLLILQAKSKKGASRNVTVDLVVHPDNDMRQVKKAYRKEKKALFNRLFELSNELSSLLPRGNLLSRSFQDIKIYFVRCLDVISDEKLTARSGDRRPIDGHSLKLFTLSTRSGKPLSLFAQGFFAREYYDWEKIFNQFKTYSFEDIKQSVAHLQLTADPEDEDIIATYLFEFLTLMTTQKCTLQTFAHRLEQSHSGDISKPIQRMLETDFFSYLRKRSSLDHHH